MKHKAILYRQILLEKKERKLTSRDKSEERVSKFAMLHNGIMYALTLFFKIIIISIISIIGTVFLTAIANAIINGIEVKTVIKEMYDNIKQFI